MVVVPALLLSKRPGQAVWRINGFGIAIMITKCGKDGTFNVVLQHVIDGDFCVFDICSAELILSVVRDKVASVDTPCEVSCFCTGAGQWPDRLQSSETKVVRGVALESTIQR